MKKQGGFLFLSMAALTAALTFMILFTLTAQQVMMHNEHNRWVEIAKTSYVILDGVEKYFEYDCYQDGIVNLPTYNQLVNLGFINSELILNPYKFEYSVDLTRPSYSFNSSGRAIADGATKFKAMVTLNDDYMLDRLTSALIENKIPYPVSGATITILKEHVLSQEQANNQYLNGNVSFTCA